MIIVGIISLYLSLVVVRKLFIEDEHIELFCGKIKYYPPSEIKKIIFAFKLWDWNFKKIFFKYKYICKLEKI